MYGNGQWKFILRMLGVHRGGGNDYVGLTYPVSSRDSRAPNYTSSILGGRVQLYIK